MILTIVLSLLGAVLGVILIIYIIDFINVALWDRKKVKEYKQRKGNK